MILWREAKRRARHIVAPVLGAAVVGYFAYHTLQGDRGLKAYMELKQDVEQLQEEVDALSGERRVLENRVARLRPDGLDLDLLEERARAQFNLVQPDEAVILLNDRR
ncbi:MAG: septum formation initiator family protein [Alphaproteobacteria bacterium]